MPATNRQIYFGTVVRNAPADQGGELVVLDWDQKQVIGSTPVAPRDPDFDDDPNPRGNTRGCKGIVLYGDGVVAADYHTLRFYDRGLVLQRTLSHGLMVGLHEVAREGDRNLRVTSTAIDGALSYDLESGELVDALWPREMPAFQKALGLEPAPFDKSADQRANFLDGHSMHNASHLHLNAVARWRGEVYALFNAFGAIANLSRGEVVIQDSELVKGHNLVILEDGTAVANATHGPAVRFYDLAARRLIDSIDLLKFPWVRSLRRRAVAANAVKSALRTLRIVRSSMAKPLFARGLAVSGDHVFVGVSPASILCIDRRTHELVDAYRYSRNVHVCVHGLVVAD